MATVKKQKEVFGTIKCPFCESQQNVFIGANHKYYIGCKNCGPVLATGKPYQEYILDNAHTVKQVDGVKSVEQTDTKAANDAPVVVEKPPKKRLFDF